MTSNYRPPNYNEMQTARNAMAALLENIAFLPEDIELIPLKHANYSSLCVGCTNPDASNYDPLAEIDNNSCT
jgi:hypothetical protein